MIRKEPPIVPKPLEFPKWQEPHRVTPPPATPVKVEVQSPPLDFSALEAIVEKQQAQIAALGQQFNQLLGTLVAAVQKLEPGKGLSVEVTGRDSQGRITSFKVRKE